MGDEAVGSGAGGRNPQQLGSELPWLRGEVWYTPSRAQDGKRQKIGLHLFNSFTMGVGTSLHRD